MSSDNEKRQINTIERKKLTLGVSCREPIDNISKILSVNAYGSIGRNEFVGGEAIIEGNVVFNAVYKTKDGEVKKCVCSEHFTKNEVFGDLSGNVIMLTKCSVQKIKGYAEAGYIIFSANVNICPSFIISEDIEPTAIDENDRDLRKKENTVTVTDNIFSVPLRFSVQEKSELSQRLPEIKEVLYSSVVPNITETHISAGQLVFGGQLFIQTTYSSLDEYEPIVQLNDKIDFSQVIDINFDDDKDDVNIYLSPENIQAYVSSDGENESRIINYNFDFCGYAFSCNEKEISVIDDIYSVKNKLDLEKDGFVAYNEKLIYKNQGNKNLVIPLSENKQPMSRINGVSFSVGNIENTNNKTLVQGEVSIIYQSSSGESEGFNTSLDFDIPQNTECDNKKYYSVVNINDVQGVLISGNEAEIRLSYTVFVYEINVCNVNFVKNIKKSEESEMPEFGIIIYTVQKGDTLWDILKKFGVDEQEVLSINPEIKDKITCGQKIYVFRKLAV